jgi:hypothetical protein
MPENDDAVWVGGGSFKVDREKALEKLSAYALSGEHRFLRTWLRAAAANEATRVDVSRKSDGLEVAFDGRGFTPEDLKDPYGVLFEKAKEKTEDRRYLAIGILTLLPAKPGAVDLSYGPPGKRCKTTVSRLDGERTSRLEGDEDRRTVLRVVALDGQTLVRKALEDVRDSLAAHPARVFLDGKEIDRLPRCETEPGAWIEERGFRAWLGLPSGPRAGSSVELAVDGVLAETLRMDDHDAPVRARVDSSQVSLDASHAKVVVNDRYRALSGRIERGAAELAALCRKRLEESFAADAWNRRAVLWLRDLAARTLMDPDHDADDPLKKLLWECPLYRRLDESPASLSELLEWERKDGRIVCALGAGGENAPKGTVLCEDRAELDELIARFAVEERR